MVEKRPLIFVLNTQHLGLNCDKMPKYRGIKSFFEKIKKS